MSEFVPPFPPRPAKTLPPLKLLHAASRSLLNIWEEKSFEYQFFSARLLANRIYICNSPDTVKQVLVSENCDFERKSPQMRHALEPLLGDGLFISDGATWKSRRPAVQTVVHASKLPLFAPTFVEAGAEMADRWGQLAGGQPVDILGEMAFLTSEIIARTIFGRALGAAHAREIVEGFSQYQRDIGQMDLFSVLGLPDWVPRLRGISVRRSARRIRTVLNETILEIRSAEARGNPSLLQLLQNVSLQTTGKPLDPDALRHEAAVLFMAGHETTANSLTWAWYLISQAPDVEARLHRELDNVLGGRLPGLADMPKLVYTRAIFEEAMRLYPPVPILSRQAVRDTEIRRRPIKAGSIVLVVPWLLHRHKQLWDQPDHFKPERFLPENSANRDRYAYVPFATGPRICAGASFALTEAVLCLAILAQKFRLVLKPGTIVEPIARLTLRPQHGMPMLIERRHAAIDRAADTALAHAV